jgi:hypothetical protein
MPPPRPRGPCCKRRLNKPETRFTRLVGRTVPIELAAAGSVITPKFALAMTSVGGLGMLGTAAAPFPSNSARVFPTLPHLSDSWWFQKSRVRS